MQRSDAVPAVPVRAVVYGLLAVGLLGKAALSFRQSLNGDSVVAALLFFDITEQGNYLLKNWLLPPNSYLFTDFPVYYLLGQVLGMGPAAIKLGALCVFLGSLAFFFLLLHRVFGISVALMSSLAVFSSSLFAGRILIAPTSHIGTIGATFIALLLLHRIMRHPAAGRTFWSLSAALFCVSVLAVFSDPYYVASFALPVVCSSAVLRAWKTRLLPLKEEMVLFAVIVLSCASGLFLQDAASSFGPTTVATLGYNAPERLADHALFSVEAMAHLLGIRHSPAHGGLPQALGTATSLLLFLAVLAGSLPVLLRQQSAPMRFFIVYALMVSILLGASYVVKLKPLGLPTARYLILLVYVYALFFGLVIADLRSRRWSVSRAFLLGLFIVSALLNGYQSLTLRTPQARTEITGYLKDKGFSYGYADWWDANIPDTYFGRDEWYLPSWREGESFLLTHRPDARYSTHVLARGLQSLPPDVVSGIFGPPERTLAFGDYTVYEWSHNIISNVLESVDISPETPHSTGRFEQLPGMGDVMHARPGERGLLVLGPEWAITEGSYKVRFLLQASGERDVPLARLEVVARDLTARTPSLSETGTTVLGTGEPRWREYAVDMEAGPNAKGNIVYDFRVAVTGHGDVKVKRIALERLSKSAGER
jgi:hypothetical protein